MKNKVNGLIVLILTVWLVSGCGLVETIQKTVSGDKNNSSGTTTSSNKSVTDRTIEQIADGETTGVPECDEVIKIFSDQMENKDDNWAAKATKNFVLGQIKKSFRKTLVENKNDNVKLAEQCRDYKVQLEKAISDNNNKESK